VAVELVAGFPKAASLLYLEGGQNPDRVLVLFISLFGDLGLEAGEPGPIPILPIIEAPLAIMFPNDLSI